MKLDRLVVPISVAAAAVAGGVAYLTSGKALPVVKSLVPGGMSPLRKRIINDIIPKYVPSTYGDARFSKLAPGYEVHIDPDTGKLVQTFQGNVLPESFTTCGSLPCRIGYDLGVKDGITRCGVPGMRDIGKAAGAWVDAGRRRPEPGDFYGLSQTPGGILTHVGIIIDASGPIWRTADAGQGPHDKQAAAYLDRPYDAKALTLGGPAGPRPFAGFLDVEKYMAGRAVA